ncbi:hypothetical protein V5N11_032659 [Cardamine amara subsp. amara]|uniref:Uncharacterized protein n=1 Tax=Cardamine amara subsp. amara TaxID=228776 RepID=A0ABD1B611_CARAN
MVQYTSCVDPFESAARKEKLRQAKETGKLEETAAKMVRANLAKQTRGDEIETSLQNQDIIHATLRLGPVNGDNIAGPSKQTPTKRKASRPPGKKNAQSRASPSRLPGANSRKRKSIQAGTSPRRKLNLDTQSHREENETNRSRQSRDGLPQEYPHQNERYAAPNITLIPAISRQRVDFQNPPNLVS